LLLCCSAALLPCCLGALLKFFPALLSWFLSCPAPLLLCSPGALVPCLLATFDLGLLPAISYLSILFSFFIYLLLKQH
jgi:hypothetical protein